MRLIILSFVVLIGVSCTHSPIIQKTEPKEGISVATKIPFLYNSYSPLYDEYFILKSDKELKAKDIVWFDDNAAVVDYPTAYVARIISPYNK